MLWKLLFATVFFAAAAVYWTLTTSPLALLFFVPLVGWYAVRTRQEIRNWKPGATTLDSQPPRETT